MRNGVGSEGVGVGTAKSHQWWYLVLREGKQFIRVVNLDFGARLWGLNPGSVI